MPNGYWAGLRPGGAALVAAAVLAVAAAHAEKADKPHGEKGERELPVPALFGRVSPSVVVIDAKGKDRVQGSGVVIGPGQVVTNYHVVSGATRAAPPSCASAWRS